MNIAGPPAYANTQSAGRIPKSGSIQEPFTDAKTMVTKARSQTALDHSDETELQLPHSADLAGPLSQQLSLNTIGAIALS
jgi:hypothetical protein